MNAPALSEIDLVALVEPAPPLSSIDLSAQQQPSNAAMLEFSVLGIGGGPSMGDGSADLELIATGAGYWMDVAQGAAELAITCAGQAESGFTGSGSAELRLSGGGTGYQDWVSRLPPIQLQELYRLVVTGGANGLPDLVIGGISSWQATNQAEGRSCYLQAVIPAAERYLPGLEAREGGELVIQKGYRFASGEVRHEEILRSSFDVLRPDRGQRALTITVSGYQQGVRSQNGMRTMTGVRSLSAPNGKRRVRCDIDLFAKPGMTIIALGESLRADFINYYVNRSDKFCEIGER